MAGFACALRAPSGQPSAADSTADGVKEENDMNLITTAAVGAIGFAMGAGAMLMPGSQKLKRQAQKQVDRLVKMSRSW